MDYAKLAEHFIVKQERFYARPLRQFNKFLIRDFASYINKEIESNKLKIAPLPAYKPASKVTPPGQTHSPAVTVALITEDVGHMTGGRYYCWFIASALVELGYHVTVYTNREPVFGSEFDKYKQPEIRVVTEKAKALEGIDIEADIYLGSPISGNIAAARLGQKYKKPSYALIFDPFPMMDKYLGKRTYAGWIPLIAALRNTDVNIISLCNTTSSYIPEWLNKREDQVLPIYPCINSRELPDPGAIKHGDYAVFVSRLVRHKNFDHVLKACKSLNIPLKVIASVDGINADRLVRAMNMRKNVQFCMKVSDREKFDIIRKARVVISGATFEGFGMWFIEALACGIPTVCYDYPTIHEIAEYSGADNVYMAKWNEPKELERQLDRAYREEKYREPDKRYHFEAMVKRVAGVFKQEPKIGVVTIALNEEQFIASSLKSVIKHPNVVKVAVVEGAVNLFKHAASEKGLSIDKTREKVLSVIKGTNGSKVVFEQYGWAVDKSELRNRALALLGKGVTHVLVVDADEVWKQEDLDRLVQAMRDNPTKGVFLFPFFHFWKNKNTVAIGSMWDSQLFRCFRFMNKALHWDRHEIPVVDEQGRFINVTDGSIELPDVHVYHYGYCKKAENVQAKIEYYKKRDGHVLDVKDTWTDWKPGMPTQPTHKGGTAVRFMGTHPVEIAGIL